VAAGAEGPDGPPDGPPPRAAELPPAVRDRYEARPGFINYHFNQVERDRVGKLLRAGRGGAGRGDAKQGPWELAGTLAAGGEFRIEVSDSLAVIDLPTGTSELDLSGPLDASPVPPGSGGMLAALAVWRRLVSDGPAAVGRTTYVGTAPRDPRQIDPAGGDLVDVLETAVAGVEARLSVDAGGRVVGIDLWTEPDADPCEIRITPGKEGGGAGLPAALEVWRGPERFGTFQVESGNLGGAEP
jgi:hypothetical protein